MASICCARCGEPWDSTGGIHHSHSDLTEKQYQLLLEGRGCPTCCGDPMNHAGFAEAIAMGGDEHEMRQEAVRQWRRSIEALSEGEYDYCYESLEKQPLSPVDDSEYEDEW